MDTYALDVIEVHAMLGDRIAVQVNRHHNMDPSAKFPSACFIDGDSRQQESDSARVYRLPGQSPEPYVYDKVMEQAAAAGGVLAVRLLQPFATAGQVRATLEEIRRTNRDPHLLYSQVGLALGLIPESTVREAFVNTWAEFYPSEGKAILAPLQSLLPAEPAQASAEHA